MSICRVLCVPVFQRVMKPILKTGIAHSAKFLAKSCIGRIKIGLTRNFKIINRKKQILLNLAQ
jgi:hypothetical protein